MEINHFKFVAVFKKTQKEFQFCISLRQECTHGARLDFCLRCSNLCQAGREHKLDALQATSQGDLPRHTVRTRNLSDACLFLLSFLSH